MSVHLSRSSMHTSVHYHRQIPLPSVTSSVVTSYHKITSGYHNAYCACAVDTKIFTAHFASSHLNVKPKFVFLLNRFWYFTQDLLRTIEPLESNRKWVWYVYKYRVITEWEVLHLKFKTSRYALVLEFQM